MDVQKERLLELLADQTVFGLSEEELMGLKQLKTQFPEWENDVSFELTAASINLTNLDISKEMSANLHAKLLVAADDFFNQADATPTAINSTPKIVETVGRSVELEPKRPFWQWLGWAVAAAACIALAVNLWQTRSRPQPEIVSKTPETVQTPTPKPQLTAAQEREQLLATARDVVQTTWTSPTDKTKVLGDIVWSNERQQGYMRFRGLPPNDPNREAYQLWIADETQNPKTPISGGVFDISSTGEVVVPIDAQITVKKPKAFNITKEKPGGVVVSHPSKVVAVAAI